MTYRIPEKKHHHMELANVKYVHTNSAFSFNAVFSLYVENDYKVTPK
ncbi:hypothetical protein JOD45_003001 [Scopulibacillus daqui]|uniref:Uncharacterized protein n=1 Tax=Scopulibacillus daqui TaxID=1469162 RepID=A0ABS2Q394_9BACL|nr:hypothetical protein [Scopulibacillus daqui]MBM7646767.1 hypothetical protein [Scopulibacillus daqui]